MGLIRVQVFGLGLIINEVHDVDDLARGPRQRLIAVSDVLPDFRLRDVMLEPVRALEDANGLVIDDLGYEFQDGVPAGGIDAINDFLESRADVRGGFDIKDGKGVYTRGFRCRFSRGVISGWSR